MGTATLLVRHQVTDYGTWRATYDGLEGLRQKYGGFADEVMVDPSNNSDVYVIHRFPSLQDAQDFAHSPELRDGMTKAGIVGAPRIEIAVEA